jgi:hypothetical protein
VPEAEEGAVPARAGEGGRAGELRLGDDQAGSRRHLLDREPDAARATGM